MSNAVWQRRRLRQRLLRALKVLEQNPEAEIHGIVPGMVVVSVQRWQGLNAGLTLVPDTSQPAIRV